MTAACLAAMLIASGGVAAAAPAATGVIDPALAFMPDMTGVDPADVLRARAEKAKARQNRRNAAGASVVHNEREAAGVTGVNDTRATADVLAKFGTGHHDKPKFTLIGDNVPDDQDFYAFDLRPGDTVGASVTGGAKRLVIFDSAGREVFGSSQDLTSLYPVNSPLPVGGNAVVDFVAPKAGRYFLAVQQGVGAYQVALEVYRPGSESDAFGTVQTLFLDFNGAEVDTAIFGFEGVRQLSPLSTFLGGWGLTAADEDAVIDVVQRTVRENIEKDLARKGTNPRFAVRVRNSRDHADTFGQPDVTRLIVGGSVAESGINTVGIAQTIDPGNFGHEETALILLDRMSAPAGPTVSLNTYLTPASDRIEFIGRAVGNVVAHEAGHMAGSWHLDQFNEVPSLMDQGDNPKIMFQVGADGVGGTADDPDLDFTEDVLNPNEGFTGIEDTLNRTAWAFTRGG
jgi:hypothetical protein